MRMPWYGTLTWLAKLSLARPPDYPSWLHDRGNRKSRSAHATNKLPHFN